MTPVDALMHRLGPCVLLRIPRGKKGPITPDWQKLMLSDMTPEYLASFNGDNIGVSPEMHRLGFARSMPTAMTVSKNYSGSIRVSVPHSKARGNAAGTFGFASTANFPHPAS